MKNINKKQRHGLLFLISLGAILVIASENSILSFLPILLILVVPGALLIENLLSSSINFCEYITLSVGASMVLSTTILIVVDILSDTTGEFTSLSPFTVSLCLIVTILILWVASLRNSNEYAVRVKPPKFRDLLLASSIIITIIAGALILKQYGENIFIVMGGALIVPYAMFSHRFSNNALITYSLAISVLLITNLSSDFVHGFDIQITYAAAHEMLEAGDVLLSSGAHSDIPMVTALPAAISSMTGYKLASIYTIIFPSLYSLFPVTIYIMSSKYFNKYYGVISAAVVIFFPGFFLKVPGKQRIAQLLLSILILTAITESFRHKSKLVLIILLLTGIVFSHYGTSYLLIMLLMASYGLYLVLKYHFMKINIKLKTNVVRVGILGYMMMMSWSFYKYMGYGHFDDLILALKAAFEDLVEGGSSTRTGVAIVTEWTEQIRLYLYLAIQGTIGIGFAKSAVGYIHGKKNIDEDIFLLSFSFMVLLAVSFVARGNFGVDRAYILALTVLAIYFPVGISLFLQFLPIMSDGDERVYSVSISVLVMLFIITSGLGVEILANSDNPSLNDEAIGPYFNPEEVKSFYWVSTYKNKDGIVASDHFGYLLLKGVGVNTSSRTVYANSTVEGLDYIIIRYSNNMSIISTKPMYRDGEIEWQSIKGTLLWHRIVSQHKIAEIGNTSVYHRNK